jgi:hypothetical protein
VGVMAIAVVGSEEASAAIAGGMAEEAGSDTREAEDSAEEVGMVTHLPQTRHLVQAEIAVGMEVGMAAVGMAARMARVLRNRWQPMAMVTDVPAALTADLMEAGDMATTAQGA